MTPNVFAWISWGKMVFVAVDIAMAWLVAQLLLLRHWDAKATTLAVSTILWNPLLINLSTRGSADGLVVVLVLATVYALVRRRFWWAAIAYGLAVHVKIYPIIHALPLVLFMDEQYAPADWTQPVNSLADLAKQWRSPEAWTFLFECGSCAQPVHEAEPESDEDVPAPTPSPVARRTRSRSRSRPAPAPVPAPQRADRARHQRAAEPSLYVRALRIFSPRRVSFGLVSAGVCLGLIAGLYLLYGWTFLYEAYLHHFVRADNRHNFSVYFYDMYLRYGLPTRTGMGLAAFLPQFGSVLAVGAVTYQDLPLCITVQTLLFVAFNKVCTAQYFMWWMIPLAAVLPACRLSGRAWAAWIVAWFATEIAWLYWGSHVLENLGGSVFGEVWLASLAFFAVNCALAGALLKCTYVVAMFDQGQLVDVPEVIAAHADMKRKRA